MYHLVFQVFSEYGRIFLYPFAKISLCKVGPIFASLMNIMKLFYHREQLHIAVQILLCPDNCRLRWRIAPRWTTPRSRRRSCGWRAPRCSPPSKQTAATVQRLAKRDIFLQRLRSFFGLYLHVLTVWGTCIESFAKCFLRVTQVVGLYVLQLPCCPSKPGELS